MTYTATITDALETRTIDVQTFKSLKKAKEFVRTRVDSDHSAIIGDDEFKTRYIKARWYFGKFDWTGNAPENWFKS